MGCARRGNLFSGRDVTWVNLVREGGTLFSGRDVTWGNLVLGGVYGGTSIGPGELFSWPGYGI